jgi:hypothetical protein
MGIQHEAAHSHDTPATLSRVTALWCILIGESNASEEHTASIFMEETSQAGKFFLITDVV